MQHRIEFVNEGPEIIEIPEELDRLQWDVQLCKSILQTGADWGHVILRVPWLDPTRNERMTTMLEHYFAQTSEVLANDIRPEEARQGGLTEKEREGFGDLYDVQRRAILRKEHQPFPSTGNCLHRRFFHGLGTPPPNTEFGYRYITPFNPEGFPEWCDTMNAVGKDRKRIELMMLSAIEVALELPPSTITRYKENAPDLMSPTAFDLDSAEYGMILSDFHDDFNPITVHGPSRFRCLMAWNAKNEPFLVVVPRDCVLVQFGLQMQWLTAGILGDRGRMHQVVVVDETLEDLAHARKAGESTMRIGSVYFGHFNTDMTLFVPPQLARKYPESLVRLPPTQIGKHSEERIHAIGLAAAQKAA